MKEGGGEGEREKGGEGGREGGGGGGRGREERGEKQPKLLTIFATDLPNDLW